jgi:hypothetical protein
MLHVALAGIVCVAAIALGAQCGPKPAPMPPTGYAADCAGAAANIHRLGCKMDRPDFADFCSYELALPKPPFSPRWTACLSTAPDCASAEKCP